MPERQTGSRPSVATEPSWRTRQAAFALPPSSLTTACTREPFRPTQAPIEACSGNAQVTYLPGHPLAVTMDVGAHMVITSEAAARDLYRCLDQIFGPLAESRRAACSPAARS